MHLGEDGRRPDGRYSRYRLVEADHVRAILTHIAGLLATARWSSIVPSIVDVAEHDPAFADIHSRIQRRHAAPLRSALERAALRGEIPPSADRDAMAAALLGPLFYRRWFSREQIDAAFLQMIVGTLASLCQDPPSRREVRIADLAGATSADLGGSRCVRLARLARLSS